MDKKDTSRRRELDILQTDICNIMHKKMHKEKGMS